MSDISANSKIWNRVKAQYHLGEFVRGEVEFHTPFGVFVNIGEPSAKGLIKIPDFLDEGRMSPEMYPEIGTKIGAVVVGYNESNRCEIYLSAKPSILHKVLVPLNTPALAGT